MFCVEFVGFDCFHFFFFFISSHHFAFTFLYKALRCVTDMAKCTVNPKKYYLCYKCYSPIESLQSERVGYYVVRIILGSLVWHGPAGLVQHNIGFIKYHNSRTNIYMPACFLTKMAAIGKRMTAQK